MPPTTTADTSIEPAFFRTICSSCGQSIDFSPGDIRREVIDGHLARFVTCPCGAKTPADPKVRQAKAKPA